MEGAISIIGVANHEGGGWTLALRTAAGMDSSSDYNPCGPVLLYGTKIEVAVPSRSEKEVFAPLVSAYDPPCVRSDSSQPDVIDMFLYKEGDNHEFSRSKRIKIDCHAPNQLLAVIIDCEGYPSLVGPIDTPQGYRRGQDLPGEWARDCNYESPRP
ncbi:MAG TPA: hypothetical protein VJ874_06970 [Candidatus Thermoplasmatota archaeon]|nr:hypothetical protein [Candidatus Thermoplasmatota archaeon]